MGVELGNAIGGEILPELLAAKCLGTNTMLQQQVNQKS